MAYGTRLSRASSCIALQLYAPAAVSTEILAESLSIQRQEFLEAVQNGSSSKAAASERLRRTLEVR